MPERRMQPLETEKKTRIITFYLPQYHPIPENDAWWGKGFTEWTNVIRAKPLFNGHYQPHIPADLGFYDLRVPEARQAQTDLARTYGVEGFCYWHYWFNGKRLLEKPFNDVLASGQPEFPFCLAWANETWSRRWLGEERDILQKQLYSTEDDYNHIRWLIKAFADPRYVRVQGRPLFAIYRPLDLPDAKRTTDIFRSECVRHGLAEPYLLGINAHRMNLDHRQLGFDGTLDFDPQLGVLPGFNNDSVTLSKLRSNLKLGVLNPKLKIYDYNTARELKQSKSTGVPTHPCIFVGWDNTPRRGRNGVVIVGATPEVFATHLSEVIRSVAAKPFEEGLIFINAWNEWAEGNHLEPDLKHGLGYLEAIKRVNTI